MKIKRLALYLESAVDFDQLEQLGWKRASKFESDKSCILSCEHGNFLFWVIKGKVAPFGEVSWIECMQKRVSESTEDILELFEWLGKQIDGLTEGVKK